MDKKFLIGMLLATGILIAVGVFILGKQKPANPQNAIDQTQLLENARNTKGNPDAPVVIIEFSDFQCPACAASFPIIKQVLENNQDKVYFVYKHYPLATHKNADLAAQAAETAAKQGKFWEMHDLIFTNQSKWENSSDAKDIFASYANDLELDVEKFKADFNDTKGLVNQDYTQGNKVNVNSTPTFFINGERQSGVLQAAQFQAIIDNITSEE